MPQGWVAFRHGLFLQSRPELASKMCTGKNRHFVLKEAMAARAKANGEGYQGAAAPRHAAAATTPTHKSGGCFAKTGIMPNYMPIKTPKVYSDTAGLASLTDNQFQTVQHIKSQLDEAIHIERMKLQQRVSDNAAAGRDRLQGYPTSLQMQRDFPQAGMDTSRLLALQQQAYRRASLLSSAVATAPRLHGHESLLLEQQAQRRTSSLSSYVPELHEHDRLLSARTHLFEEHRLLALQERISARETQLRQELQEKEARLASATVSLIGHREDVNQLASGPAVTEGERQRLLRLREQLDFIIGM
jgi:hypothetical protein